MSVRIPRTHPKVHYLAVVNFNTDSIFFQMSAIDNVYIVKCCLILYVDGLRKLIDKIHIQKSKSLLRKKKKKIKDKG